MSTRERGEATQRYTIIVFDEFEERPVELTEAVERKLQRLLARLLREDEEGTDE
jgi:hypothetical protein